jgi:hypothetical protein
MASIDQSRLKKLIDNGQLVGLFVQHCAGTVYQIETVVTPTECLDSWRLGLRSTILKRRLWVSQDVFVRCGVRRHLPSGFQEKVPEFKLLLSPTPFDDGVCGCALKLSVHNEECN